MIESLLSGDDDLRQSLIAHTYSKLSQSDKFLKIDIIFMISTQNNHTGRCLGENFYDLSSTSGVVVVHSAGCPGSGLHLCTHRRLCTAAERSTENACQICDLHLNSPSSRSLGAGFSRRTESW